MARFLVIVMCPSARAPPVPVRRLASSATKSPTTQKAAYVPGHIKCQFRNAVLIETAAWVGGGFLQLRDRQVAIFIADLNCGLHNEFLLFVCVVVEVGRTD